MVEFKRPSFDTGGHKRTKDKCWICGMAPTIAQLPPDAEDSGEIWKINEAYRLDAYYDRPVKATRWFQLHKRWDYTRRQNRASTTINVKDHWAWLRQDHDFPIYMQQEWEDIPDSVEFPLDEMCKDFGIEGNPHLVYFRNSTAYLIAFAVWMGFKEIGIYGWELASETEMMYEKPSALFWLGIAAAYLGPENIDIPVGSKLAGWGQRRYAYDDVPAVNRMHVESRMGDAKQKEYQALRELRRLPSDLNTRDAAMYASGQVRAYQDMIEELDDVMDPRGSFEEEEDE